MKIKLVANKEYKELEKLREAFSVSDDGEICIALGGDGTLIRAARNYNGPILPIRSGEKGSIGYYSDLSFDDIDFAIKKLRDGDYTIEKLENKMLLNFAGKEYHAVNEVLLHNVLEEVSFRIYEIRNDRRYEIYPYIISGDGIIVTGAIGSTAYNKAARGPIIMVPNVMCMTFLNVDGPYSNPIVVDDSKIIEIEIVKYTGTLRYDGIDLGVLNAGDKFRIMTSKEELKMVRFNEKKEEFAQKLDRIIKSRMVNWME